MRQNHTSFLKKSQCKGNEWTNSKIVRIIWKGTQLKNLDMTCYYKLNYTITDRVSSSSVNEYMLCVDHVCQQAI